jgi:hypothetical protein
VVELAVWTLFLLLCGHALADGPLQTPDIAAGKRSAVGLERAGWLLGHGLLHGGAVALVTGSALLGLAETLAHAGIDAMRSREHIPSWFDQGLHLLCKVLWTVIVLYC